MISLIQVLITLVTLSLEREELYSQADGDSALYLQVPGCAELVLDKIVKLKMFPDWAPPSALDSHTIPYRENTPTHPSAAEPQVLYL